MTPCTSGPERDPTRGEPADPATAREERSLRELITSSFNWVFRNRKTGAITVVQLPNLPLWIFLLVVVLRRVVPDGEASAFFDWAAVVALSWWAIDEVLRGVNPWRRFLGLLGCAAATAEVASLLG